ncbi:unnamed protein product [Moneuplotes crassus]|uniref:Uncharacterized protein n=1 Tax=Euplotes crassus TaxID=5936 RepID=A0AAD1UGH1_EUPCR|nr:unnamed protein product [Moneuplotes crassus]
MPVMSETSSLKSWVWKRSCVLESIIDISTGLVSLLNSSLIYFVKYFLLVVRFEEEALDFLNSVLASFLGKFFLARMASTFEVVEGTPTDFSSDVSVSDSTSASFAPKVRFFPIEGILLVRTFNSSVFSDLIVASWFLISSSHWAANSSGQQQYPASLRAAMLTFTNWVDSDREVESISFSCSICCFFFWRLSI